MDREQNEKEWRFCAVGNIVKSHIDEEGVERYGTKAFTGGTKVYVNGKDWDERFKKIDVIGRNRFGRIVLEFISPDLIENVRVQAVFKPHILKIIDYEERIEDYIWWERTAADKREAKAFAEAWNEKRKREIDGSKA